MEVFTLHVLLKGLRCFAEYISFNNLMRPCFKNILLFPSNLDVLRVIDLPVILQVCTKTLMITKTAERLNGILERTP